MNIKIVYHRPCVDGFAAAWAARYAMLNNERLARVSYVGSAPNQKIDLGDPSLVYYLDICPKREFLIEQLNAGHKIVVLDHHKTAIEDVAGLTHPQLTLIMDESRSGAMLAWNYFNANEEPLRAFQWVQDRDLWKKELPESEAAVETLLAYDYDFETWDALICDPNRLLRESAPLLALKRKRVGEIVSRYYISNVGGYDVPVVNADFYINEVLEALTLKVPEAPFAAAWYRRGNGSKKWSVRSQGGFDVQALAKRFGGGGHPGSAGFVAP